MYAYMLIPYDRPGPASGSEWCIYDVGGSRTQRNAWYPYFDDCDAIIFLAPISCFDERLAEDRRVNRLEDSFGLWQSICASEVLKDVILIRAFFTSSSSNSFSSALLPWGLCGCGRLIDFLCSVYE